MINYDETGNKNEKKVTQIRQNTPRPRHGQRHKYKICLSMIMLIYIKQHLSNI